MSKCDISYNLEDNLSAAIPTGRTCPEKFVIRPVSGHIIYFITPNMAKLRIKLHRFILLLSGLTCKHAAANLDRLVETTNPLYNYRSFRVAWSNLK